MTLRLKQHQLYQHEQLNSCRQQIRRLLLGFCFILKRDYVNLSYIMSEPLILRDINTYKNDYINKLDIKKQRLE